MINDHRIIRFRIGLPYRNKTVLNIVISTMDGCGVQVDRIDHWIPSNLIDKCTWRRTFVEGTALDMASYEKMLAVLNEKIKFGITLNERI